MKSSLKAQTNVVRWSIYFLRSLIKGLLFALVLVQQYMYLVEENSERYKTTRASCLSSSKQSASLSPCSPKQESSPRIIHEGLVLIVEVFSSGQEKSSAEWRSHAQGVLDLAGTKARRETLSILQVAQE